MRQKMQQSVASQRCYSNSDEEVKQVVVEGTMCHNWYQNDCHQADQTDDWHRYCSAAPYYTHASHTQQ